MKLLVDHNLPPPLARAAHVLVNVDGHEVVALRDKFPANTSDVDWLTALGMEGGWSILSLDHHITRRPSERLALHKSRVTGFFLAPGWARMSSVEKTGRFLLWWNKLVQATVLVQSGAVYEVPINPSSTLKQLRLP